MPRRPLSTAKPTNCAACLPGDAMNAVADANAKSRLVVVSGLSGSGKSVALRTLGLVPSIVMRAA